MTATRRPGSGPPPTPTHLRILRGNPSRKPLPEHEPQPEAKLPRAPTELSDGAKKIWLRDGKKLLALGVMTTIDEGAFAAYCQSYARWLEVTAMLAKSGPLIKDGQGGLKLNPLLKVARDAQLEYTRAANDFGMTPSSRTRIHAQPPAERDEFQGYLDGRRSS